MIGYAPVARTKVGAAKACWAMAVVAYVGCLGSRCEAVQSSPLPSAAPKAAIASNAPENAEQPRTLEARLREARASLAAERAPGDGGLTNVPAGVSPQDLSIRRTLLERMVRLYEQQLSAVAELESTKARKLALSREAQTWTQFTEPVPYSIQLTDRLREEIQAERMKISRTEAAIAVLDQLGEENRKSLKVGEEKIRQYNEQLEKEDDSIGATRLSWQRDLERIRSQVAIAAVSLFEVERSVRQETLAASRIQLGLLQRQLLIADAKAAFTQTDLDQSVERLETEREQLERELTDARARRAATAEALAKAREELESTKSPGAVPPTDLARAAEVTALRETKLQAADASIRALQLMLECGNVERTMWEQRFTAYESRSAQTLTESARRLANVTRRIGLWRDHENQLLDLSAAEVQLQQTRLNALAPGTELWRIAGERLSALRELDELALRTSRRIERIERLSQRWNESLRVAETKLPFTGKVQSLFSEANSFLKRLWNFEVFSAEDTLTVDGQKITGRRSITISKMALALIILVLGYWLTGRVTRWMQPILVRRMKIEPNQATLVGSWLRTAVVVCLVLFSLTSVKIPLTVFAFAGGALAIGLGFGMQTMLKNLVSGLIILFERPFRVGDVLDVGGQRGAVTSIGLRASVLQLWDGTETLIPNSNLLENNLTNWTYSNRKVRFTVAVGVAYGSDPRRVIELLGDAAERHGLVEKDPKRQVFFTDFGESTLNFELRFWVDVTRVNAAQVSSDLRMMISGAFAEQGIIISFPQRDVHLDSAHPIPVQLVPGATFQLAASR